MGRVGVESTSKRNTLLLSTRKCDALFSNQCFVAVVENLEVAFQCTSHNDIAVPLLVKWCREENVFADVCINQPSGLCDVGDRVGETSLRVGVNVFSAAATRTVNATFKQSHFAKKTHQHGCLSGTCRACDDIQFTDLEINVQIHESESTGTILSNSVFATPRKSSVVETNSPDTVVIHIIQAKLDILVGLFLLKKLLHTIDRNLGFLDVGEHIAK